jgi:hypothetical protein
MAADTEYVPLSGEDRKSSARGQNDAIDPKATSNNQRASADHPFMCLFI